MAYFLSPALEQLRAEVNLLFPHRDRTSDGWIGDASHAARPSDHNPDWSSGGIVRAVDLDEDMVMSLSADGRAAWLVDQIIRDPRVKYVIYEGRIWQNPAVYGASKGGWRTYSGPNAHRHHVHISVRKGAAWDRNRSSWGLVFFTSSGAPSTGVDLNLPAFNTLTPIDKETDMDRLILIRKFNAPEVYISDFMTRRHLKTERDLQQVQQWIKSRGGDDTVHVVDNPGIFGPVTN